MTGTVTVRKRLATLLLASIVALSLSRCSLRRHDRESLNEFVAAYYFFWTALSDAQSSSLLMRVHRSAFTKALDPKASHRERVEAARQDISNARIQTILDNFSKENEVVDEKSLALVEAANMIGDERYRKQAVGIARTARNIQQHLEKLYINCAVIYDLQVKLMKAVVDTKGDLSYAFSLKDDVPAFEKLLAQQKQLQDEEEASSRAIQEQYAAFKGMTRLTLDYVEPPTTQNSEAQH